MPRLTTHNRSLPLRRRLIFSALLGTIPLFLLGLALIAFTYRLHRTQALQENLTIAKLAATSMDGWVTGNVRLLRTLAESGEVQAADLAEMQALINRQKRAQPEWDGLFITEENGRVIADGILGLSVADRGFFQEARRMRQPAVSNLLISRVTQHYVVIIAHPIIRNGQFGGIVAVAITPETIQQLFLRIDHPADTAIALWGRDMRLIARTDTPTSMLGRKYSSPDAPWVVSGRSGTGAAENPVSHEQTLVGFAPVPMTPWTIVAGTPLRSALAPVYQAVGLFLLAALLVFAGTLAWTLISANTVARQVTTLADSARRIGAGQFETRVLLHTGGELEDLSNSLNKMAGDLAIAARLQSDLLNMVSHELKTPLTTIRGVLELLESGLVTPQNPQYHDLLDSAQRQTRRLGDMIENLLHAARSEAGSFAIVPRPTDLAPIIRASLAQYEGLAHEKGLTVRATIPEGIRVCADRPKVTLALNNLLDNAIKFTATGTITVEAAVTDGHVTVTVADTGIGITPEVRVHLFEKFYQAEPLMTRRVAGTGLGLVVVKTIIEAHGGTVFMHSGGENQGTTVGFTLPLAQEDAAS